MSFRQKQSKIQSGENNLEIFLSKISLRIRNYKPSLKCNVNCDIFGTKTFFYDNQCRYVVFKFDLQTEMIKRKQRIQIATFSPVFFLCFLCQVSKFLLNFIQLLLHLKHNSFDLLFDPA